MVNLVADSLKGKDDGHQSYANPTKPITRYLHPDYQHCFTYRTWEGWHAHCVAGDPTLADLDSYLRGKSAHYGRPFVLG